jgi:hypothetical protein
MSDPVQSSQPPLLHYADLPPGIGLIVETLPDGVRITQPPAPGAGAAIVILAIFISPIVLLVILATADLDALRRMLRGIKSVFRPMIIEVTGPSLSLLNIEIDGTYQDVIRPRESVYELRFIEHSGNLFIRAHGQEIIDCRPFRDPRMLRWLANVLVQALGLK